MPLSLDFPKPYAALGKSVLNAAVGEERKSDWFRERSLERKSDLGRHALLVVLHALNASNEQPPTSHAPTLGGAFGGALKRTCRVIATGTEGTKPLAGGALTGTGATSASEEALSVPHEALSRARSSG